MRNAGNGPMAVAAFGWSVTRYNFWMSRSVLSARWASEREDSLWLGHASIQSTDFYLRADPTEKLKALAKMAPPTLQRGHFKAPDKLLAMLRDVSHRKNYAE